MNKTLMCIDCVKDTKLKKYFLLESTEKGICTFCKKQHHICLGIEESKTFVSLTRALIRYHYSEIHYNRHFGGDSISELLSNDNEVFNSERVEDDTDLDILSSIIDGLSLDDNIEVALYYGHIEGTRGAFLERIKDYTDTKVEKLEKELLETNYFLLEEDFLKDLKSYKKYFNSYIQEDTHFYRARVGYKKKDKVNKLFYDPSDKNAFIKYIPYKKSRIGAPPISSLQPGRLNRAGLSYLYLATDIETALTEVRPDPGHKVSIGCFNAIKKLKIADLDQAFIRMAKNENMLMKYRYLNHIDQLLSRAITKDERHKYLITQFFSDGFRKLGFDGILYSSSITNGQNLLIFNPSNFEYVEYESAVYDIESVKYKYSKLENGNGIRIYDAYSDKEDK